MTTGPVGHDGPPGTLPFTGARSPLLLAAGGGLLVAGVALVALVRRRPAPTIARPGTTAEAARVTLAASAYWKALRPVMAWPIIRVWISLVPS